MITFTNIYILSAFVGSFLSIYINYLDRKDGKNFTLGDLLLFMFITFSPIVNVGYAFVGLGWFIFSESPRIVILGKKR